MENKKPTILVIIGITGDLSSRKLLPALGEILEAGVLPEIFHIVGVTRQSEVDIEKLLSGTKNKEAVKKSLTVFQMDLTNEDGYKNLYKKLEEIEGESGTKCERLYYLSVPPQVSLPIIEFLGTSGLSKVPNTKLLLEKPFGTDMTTAKEMIRQIEKHFTPLQVYRIDHYLAKEMTQNMIVFREGNSLFRQTWNNKFIESIVIIASEEIGIEGRSLFYEQTGALRDVVQSHLLQLAAITLMDINDLDNTDDVPDRRLSALKSLQIPKDKPIDQYVIRGQYEGYKEEVKNGDSKVETFVSIRLESNSPRWEGVPITLVAGKALDRKATEIKIYYKKDHDAESNELILRIQPDESIIVRLWSNRPGYEKKIEKHMLDFKYSDYYDKLPEAYEQVLLDATRSNHNLFTSSDEVLESWRIVDPIQKMWGSGEGELYVYKAGTNPIDIGKA